MEPALAMQFVRDMAKNASGLLVAIFCQIYTTQYKIHKFLRGLEHCWLPVAKIATGKLLASYWLSTGKNCLNL
jgi:hypothetical protein